LLFRKKEKLSLKGCLKEKILGASMGKQPQNLHEYYLQRILYQKQHLRELQNFYLPHHK